MNHDTLCSPSEGKRVVAHECTVLVALVARAKEKSELSHAAPTAHPARVAYLA